MNSEKTENMNGVVEMFDSFGGQLALAPVPVNNTLNKSIKQSVSWRRNSKHTQQNIQLVMSIFTVFTV